MICFHKWGKWKRVKIKAEEPLSLRLPVGYDYKGPVSFSVEKIYQKRTCNKCGKAQMEWLV